MATPASSPSSGAAGGGGDSAAAERPRLCQGCGKEEAAGDPKFLSCPTCIDLNISPNCFCSQSCFKSAWSKHKGIHEVMRLLLKEREAEENAKEQQTLSYETYDPNDRTAWRRDPHLRRFLSYRFTGPLRPWPITPRRPVPPSVSLPDYAATGIPLGERRLGANAGIKVHTNEEIERIRAACLLGREALDLAHAMIRPGVRGEEIDRKVHEFIVSKGGYPSPLNYQGFPKSCCVSVNEVICHGIPDWRPLEEGDIVNVDITVYLNGMHGDLNETFCCGKVDEGKQRLLQGAYLCLMEAVKSCKPGMMYRDIGRVVSAVADKYKLSVVRSYCGHGIGELFHTAPNVPHYKNNKAVGVLKPGHVFTLEPMLNLGSSSDALWPDDWTAVTADGSPSAQFEHTLLCTDTGVEVLTKRLPSSPKLDVDTMGHDLP